MLKTLNSMTFDELMADLTANISDPATNCTYIWCGRIPANTIPDMSKMLMDMVPIS
jgi:hypothetical protein